MELTKGADVIALRKILAEKGEAVEQAFLQKLTPELVELYQGIMATSWTPVDKQMAIYTAAAEALFPGQPEHMANLGYALAQKTFTGIYRIFFRIPSIAFIMKRVATLWRSYYNKGDASVENVKSKSLELVVRNFPELRRKMLEVAKGHSRYIIELTGARHVHVELKDDEPEAWRWIMRWE